MTVKNLFRILGLCIVITFLFPIFKLGKTSSFKLDWFFIKITFIVLFLFFEKLIKVKLYRQYLIILVLISVCYIISNYIGGSIFAWNSNYGLPIYIGIIDRISVFVFFSYLIYKGFFQFDNLKILISSVFLIGLIFGVFQYFDLYGARNIALKYYLDAESVQEYNFLKFNRILGVAPAIITWGGLCVFICHYFLFVENSKIIKIIGVLLGALNVMMAGSRAAIISLVLSLMLVFVIKAIIIDKKLGSFLKILIVLISAFVLAFILFKTYMPLQFDFLISRFDNAEAALTTEGRGSQLEYFMHLFERKPIGVLVGTGNQAIKDYGYLEIDYAYLFFGYGIFSFILHYLLLFLLLKQAYKFKEYNYRLFLFIWGSTLGYLIFSAGFFFFKELYMGMVFWWVNGAVIGYLWLLSKHNQNVYEK